DARALLGLLMDHVAEQAALAIVVVGSRVMQLVVQPLRRDRGGGGGRVGGVGRRAPRGAPRPDEQGGAGRRGALWIGARGAAPARTTSSTAETGSRASASSWRGDSTTTSCAPMPFMRS